MAAFNLPVWSDRKPILKSFATGGIFGEVDGDVWESPDPPGVEHAAEWADIDP